MATLFISDLHLEDGRPELGALLLRFLASEEVRSAQALYILGDLFEYWIGDDFLSETARQVGAALSGLSSAGLPCYFIHGNRDFLLGEAYARDAGLELLPETVVIDLHGQNTLLMHGDTLCTDDVEYQAFRQQSRNPAWQAQILALTPEQRIELAKSARDASQQHMSTAAMEIMDVNDEAVIGAFEQHGVTRMIHGHTHRPAFHDHRLADGAGAQRIVLSDWGPAGSYLRVDETGCTAIDIPA